MGTAVSTTVAWGHVRLPAFETQGANNGLHPSNAMRWGLDPVE